MRFIIYGAGGIGGTIGARLFQQREDVTLIARGPHLEAIQRNGLLFISKDGEHQLKIPAISGPHEHQWREGDVVLLCVKSQHTAKALEDLRWAAGDKTPVVCIQNGVFNEEIALRLFSQVYGVHVFLPASHIKPGVVVTYGHEPGGVLDIGAYPRGVKGLSLELALAFERAGFSSIAQPSIMAHKYTKLLSNLNNTVQVVTSELADSQKIFELLREEALACFKAAGIEFVSEEEATKRRTEGLHYAEIPGHPRPGGSSWQSIERGTGDIEVDYLNGEIVSLGRRYGIKTPANLLMQRLGNDVAWGKCKPQSFSPAQLISFVESMDMPGLGLR